MLGRGTSVVGEVRRAPAQVTDCVRQPAYGQLGDGARVCASAAVGEGIFAGIGGVHGLNVGPGEGEGEGITAGISGAVGGFHCEMEGETGETVGPGVVTDVGAGVGVGFGTGVGAGFGAGIDMGRGGAGNGRLPRAGHSVM